MATKKYKPNARAQLLSFDEAIEDSESVKGRRHLLMGNGFSVACRPERFLYGKLVDEADFSALNVDADQLFAREGTSDFERVIEALRTTARVLDLYEGTEGEVATAIRHDADEIKRVLAETLAKKHPDHVHEIKDEEYASARVFLANFEHLYSVNYDLLLYWALLHEEGGGPKIANDDGFRADPEDPDAEWVVWDHLHAYAQNVYYLHGGLHLYDGGSFIKKLTWSRTQVLLLDQIREALGASLYPVVVTEGNSNEKLTKIEHTHYLARGLKSLASCGGSLFIYGHSLAANDGHVLDAITKSKVTNLYVSIYGDPSSDDNARIIERAAELVAARPTKKPLEVQFFEAGSAQIWTRPGA